MSLVKTNRHILHRLSRNISDGCPSLCSGKKGAGGETRTSNVSRRCGRAAVERAIALSVRGPEARFAGVAAQQIEEKGEIPGQQP
jgi:hypothetical protein